MNRRQFVRASVGGVGMATGLHCRGWGDEAPAADRTADARGAGGEALYNGIRLPSAWPPPQLTPLPTRRGELPRDPPALPSYLKTRPAVIPIDVGRQLFVDDFLVAETTLTRPFHQPRFNPAC